MKTDLSLYIHIPFCARKCRYCDFLSFEADGGLKRRYMDCLADEIAMRGPGFADSRVISIYIGGGTPSLLEKGAIAGLIGNIKSSFFVDPDAEISIEVNPGTVNEDKLREYAACGINRLSMGLQSARDEELKLLGRIHSFEDFLNTYRLARQAGFDNINVDLISALPGQKAEDYEESLRRVAELKPEHISAYSLQLEEGTYLYEHRDEYSWPGEDLDRDLYHMTGRILEEYGYGRYEISNYSLPGFECRHNCVYWTRGQYLGLGLGAASLIGNERRTNTPDIKEYLNKNCEGTSEILDTKACMEEFMFLGLRLTDGISPERFSSTFGISIDDIYGSTLDRLEKEGLLYRNENIKLTEFGMDVSNYVFAQFLLD